MKAIVAFLLSVTLSIASHASDEVWLSPYGDNNTGSGTAGDPYIRNTSASFDYFFSNEIAGDSNLTIRLSAGVYYTKKGVAFGDGWKISGAGMDSTVVRLDVISSTNELGFGVGTPIFGGATYFFEKDNIEVSDLTVDCNLQNQTLSMNIGAVSLEGNNARIRRVKVVNWGSTSGLEAFLISISRSTHGTNKIKNCLIEDCIIGNPANVIHVGGVSGVNIFGESAGLSTPDDDWLDGAEIRGCFVSDVETQHGGGLKKPDFFNAISFSGLGIRVHNNLVMDITGGAAIYMECGSIINCVIENNMLMRVGTGIFLSGDNNGCGTNVYENLYRENIEVRNNFILPNSGGYGIRIEGHHLGGEIGRNIPTKIDIGNNRILPSTNNANITAISVMHADSVVIRDNAINKGSGAGIQISSGVSDEIIYGNTDDGGVVDPSAINTSIDPYIVHPEVYSLSFTPQTSGWYRISSNPVRNSGAFHIYGWHPPANNQFTDIEFSYDIPLYAIYGNVTVYRNLAYNGGLISKIRISTDSNLNCAVDIYLPHIYTNRPLQVEWRPGIRYYSTQSMIEPYLLTSLELPPTGIYERILSIGRGFRTSGPIYAGSLSKMITDDYGNIMADALPIGTDIQPFSQNLTSLTGATPVAYGLLFGNSTGNGWSVLGTSSSNLPSYLAHTSYGAGLQWSKIDLASGVFGSLSVNNLGGGIDASSATFWRGDGSWIALTGFVEKSEYNIFTSGVDSVYAKAGGQIFVGPVTSRWYSLGNLSPGVGSAILGGSNNVGIGNYTVIAGGWQNSILTNASYSAIGGGSENVIHSNVSFSLIQGGRGNAIENNSWYSGINGGKDNSIKSTANYAVIGGGQFNSIVNYGAFGAIPGGKSNVASSLAFAAGYRAKALHLGSFVWSDSNELDVKSTNNNSMTIRAAGGYRFFSNSNVTLGVSLAPNATAWASLSDRESKESFCDVDARDVLSKLSKMPVYGWAYKADPNKRRYIGPIAQDFYRSFGLGDEKTISTIDVDGVSLVAIQALNKEYELLNLQNSKLIKLVDELKMENGQLKKDIAEIKNKLRL